jgi:hypothetical protein
MTLDAASRSRPPAEVTEDLQDPYQARRRSRGLLGFAVVASGLAVAYTLYTQHVWEDYFITFRHSRNLAEGHGLVFQPGERVHGFTSPLGVLLPALCYLVTGKGSYLPGLWLFRVLSILAYAAGGVLLLLASRVDGEARRGQGVFIGLLYLLHVPLLDYTINGMETGFMALFVAWGFWLAVRGFEGRWGQVGLCWAGLMWTRPDSFVYVIAFTVAVMAFPPPGAHVRPRTIARAAALCAVVYLPWFVWAWWYYGSPVPHTVVAKSMLESGPMVQVKIVLKETWDRYFVIAQRAYLPAYFWKLGDWHPGLILVSGAMSVFACIYWAFPVRDRTGRLASLVFALMVLYFTAIPNLFSWYMPPAAAVGLVAVVRGVLTLAEELRPRAPRALTLAYLALGMVCVERAAFFAGTAYQMRVQQAEIEDGTRTQIGLWLKDHVKPGERVYLEPLGYIGYFSGAKMTDWPGLVAPEVVRLRREKHVGFTSILPELKPEWLVLRPGEVEAMSKTDYFRDHYAPAMTFDARPRLQKYGRIPGRSYVDNDAVFTVYRKVNQ